MVDERDDDAYDNAVDNCLAFGDDYKCLACLHNNHGMKHTCHKCEACGRPSKTAFCEGCTANHDCHNGPEDGCTVCAKLED